MPLFVPAGFVSTGLMPWLAGAIAALFFTLMQFFSKYLLKKFAVILAVIALVVSLTTGFFLAINGLVSAFVVFIPPQFTVAASWVLPSQTPTLLGFLFTARIIRWTYEWHVKVVQWKLY